MRTVSPAWTTNQAEIASCPSRLTGFIETQGDPSSAIPIWRWNVNNNHWVVGNDPTVDNVIEAYITSSFNPAGTTLPIESCSVTVKNQPADVEE